MRPELKCVAKNCKGSKSCYKFPKNNKLLYEKWLDNLGLPKDCRLNSKERVCDKHFSKDVMGKKKLTKGSVPTLNLGHNMPIIHNLPREQKRLRKCCIVGCKVTNLDGKLFSFPEGEPRRSYWFKACNLKPSQHWNICRKHFPEYMFRPSKLYLTLHSFAIPCLHLNNDNAETVSVDNESFTDKQSKTTKDSRRNLMKYDDERTNQYLEKLEEMEDSEMQLDEYYIDDDSENSEFKQNDDDDLDNNQNLHISTHFECIDVFSKAQTIQNSSQVKDKVELKSKCDCSGRESKKIVYYCRQLKLLKGANTKLRLENRKLKTKVYTLGKTVQSLMS